jgi:hypothetical protein
MRGTTTGDPPVSLLAGSTTRPGSAWRRSDRKHRVARSPRKGRPSPAATKCSSGRLRRSPEERLVSSAPASSGRPGSRRSASRLLWAWPRFEAGAVLSRLAAGCSCVQGDAEPGARLVGDRMQRQQRITPSIVSPGRQLLQRRLQTLTKDAPLRGHQVWQRAGSSLRPRAPPAARVLDLARPVSKPVRRPILPGEGEAKRLRARQHDVRQREHIRRPLQEPVRNRAAARGIPRRRWRGRARTIKDEPLVGANHAHTNSPRSRLGRTTRVFWSCLQLAMVGRKPTIQVRRTEHHDLH